MRDDQTCDHPVEDRSLIGEFGDERCDICGQEFTEVNEPELYGATLYGRGPWPARIIA